MKVFVACLLIGATQAIHHEVIRAKWSSFKAQHAKDYHPAEEPTRLENFLRTTVEIEEHNARFHRGEVSYQLGHNHLSDLTHEEAKQMLLGKKKMSLAGRNFTQVPASTMPNKPASVDWRKQGIVTRAKNQASCGSCYSFGTMGVVEAAILQSKKSYSGSEPDFAEQQIVDCSYYTYGQMNAGCDGGHEVVVMDHISKFGVDEEGSYPYRSGSTKRHSSCSRKSGKYAKGLKYRQVATGPNMEERMAEALATYGPLVISISGENRDFQMFRGGIYDNPRCPKQVDHVVSVVGYGSENGRDYWIVKNSWGEQWGENGFGKVARGKNMCGLASDNAWSIYL